MSFRSDVPGWMLVILGLLLMALAAALPGCGSDWQAGVDCWNSCKAQGHPAGGQLFNGKCGCDTRYVELK